MSDTVTDRAMPVDRLFFALSFAAMMYLLTESLTSAAAVLSGIWGLNAIAAMAREGSPKDRPGYIVAGCAVAGAGIGYLIGSLTRVGLFADARLEGAVLGAIAGAAIGLLISLMWLVRLLYRAHRTRKAVQSEWRGGEAVPLYRVLDNAALVVEYLHRLIPAWRDSIPKGIPHTPENELVRIMQTSEGQERLQNWYGGELKSVLARAGEAPMNLPKLAALEGSQERGEPSHEFSPRQALAKLVFWEGALWEEDERLVQMETQLRRTDRLWRREELFVLGQLSRSVSPATIARREERRQRLASAQSEFAEALDERDPGAGAAYRQCRDAYYEAKEVREGLSRALLLDAGRYRSDHARSFLYGEDGRRRQDLFFELHRKWEYGDDVWTDPAHEDWVEKWFHPDTWENKFAYELKTGRPARDF